MADALNPPITTVEKFKAVKREVGYRAFVYPKRVADGKMKQAAADREIAIMTAIQADYGRLVEEEERAAKEAAARRDLFGAA